MAAPLGSVTCPSTSATFTSCALARGVTQNARAAASTSPAKNFLDNCIVIPPLIRHGTTPKRPLPQWTGRRATRISILIFLQLDPWRKSTHEPGACQIKNLNDMFSKTERFILRYDSCGKGTAAARLAETCKISEKARRTRYSGAAARKSGSAGVGCDRRMEVPQRARRPVRNRSAGALGHQANPASAMRVRLAGEKFRVVCLFLQ